MVDMGMGMGMGMVSSMVRSKVHKRMVRSTERKGGHSMVNSMVRMGDNNRLVGSKTFSFDFLLENFENVLENFCCDRLLTTNYLFCCFTQISYHDIAMFVYLRFVCFVMKNHSHFFNIK